MSARSGLRLHHLAQTQHVLVGGPIRPCSHQDGCSGAADVAEIGSV